MKGKLIALILTITVIASSVVAAFALSPKNGWYTNAEDETYYYNNGEVITGLQEIDGDLYYFDTDGILQTGVINVKYNYTTEDGFIETATALYYFDPDVLLGWYEDGSGNTYYFYPAALTGLQEIRGSLYYFDDNGILQTNIWYDGYYFGSDGTPVTGLQKIAGVTYYFNESGQLFEGWNDDMYFTASGMLTGLQEIDGETYYFGEDGVLVTSEFVTTDDGVMYFGSAGTLATGLQEIDGETYYFDESGIMQTGWIKIDSKKYYFGSDGVMLTGLQEIDGEIYFFSTSDGHMLTSTLKTSGDDTYYFTSDGTALTDDTVTIDGYVYSFGSDGKLTSKTAVQTTSSSSSSSASNTSSSSGNSSSSGSSSSSSSSSGSSGYATINSDGTLNASSGNTTKIGRVTISSYTAALYVPNYGASGLNQSICDKADSAYVQTYYSPDINKYSLGIFDHSNQGLSVLWYTSVGDTATLTLCGTTVTLKCTAVYKNISDSNISDYTQNDTILIKTCESGSGNRVTIWKVSSGSLDIKTIVTAIWKNRNGF